MLCASLAAAVVTFCGCGSTTVVSPGTQGASLLRNAESAAAPVALHLDTGSYSLSGASTTLSGTVARGSKVRVNGRPVSVRAGHWSRTLELRLGKNRVTVEARLRGHAATRRTITVTREKTSEEIEAGPPAVARKTETEEQEGNAQTSTPAAAPDSPAQTCTNGTYVNSAGNTVCSPEQSSTAPPGATAQCGDGSYSFSQSRSGTCSHHEGVARWL